MINNEDKNQKELEAIQLIDSAENLYNQGRGDEAIILYEKVAKIYFDIGSYIKLDELYIRIADIISQFRNHIQAVHRLKTVIRKTEKLKLDEVSAKLLIRLGNISYKMQDWETAGESWQKAADYLYKADPKIYSNLYSVLLLKAGQTFERSSIKKDAGKRLILRAIMKINKFDELYEQEEKRAQLLIASGEFEASAKKFYDISTYFRKALEDLGNIIDEESKETLLNARARFIHFIAEYQAVAALSLRAAQNKTYNDKIKDLGNDSINLFKQSISLLKDYLFPIKLMFDKEMILRITFDTMLLAIVQELLGVKSVNPNQFLLENLNSNEALVKSLKNSPYFKITEIIEKVGIRDSLGKLSKIHLGHFETIKKNLISYYK